MRDLSILLSEPNLQRGQALTAIVFAPFAGVLRHARLERRIETLLLEKFDRVIHIGCNGCLGSRCTTMYSIDMPPVTTRIERSAICRYCRKCDEALGLNDRLVSARLEDFLDHGVAERAAEVASNITSLNWRDFEYEGIPVARYCSYEVVLQSKSDSFDKRSPLLRDLQQVVTSGIVALEAGRRIAAVYDPSLVAVHAFQYGINRCFLSGFQDPKCSKISFTNAGPYSMWERLALISQTEHLPEPAVDTPREVYEGIPLDFDEFSAVREHLRGWVESSSPWVYSIPRSTLSSAEVLKRLGIANGERCVVALTSSPDEPLAASSALLDKESEVQRPSDTDFVRRVLDASRRMPDVKFIVRMHPRLLPNKREAQASPWVGEITEILREAPPNVIANWPEDGLSLYDLALVSEAALNHRSSAGLEFICLGIPVVVPFPNSLRSYPLFLNLTPSTTSVEGLALCLQEALDTQCPDRSDAAFRWLGFLLRRRLFETGVEWKIAESGPQGARNVCGPGSKISASLKRRIRPLVMSVRALPAGETDWRSDFEERSEAIRLSSDDLIAAIMDPGNDPTGAVNGRKSDADLTDLLRSIIRC